MVWYKTTLPRSQVDGDKGKKVAEKLRGLEGPWRTQAYRETWLQDGKGNSYSTGEQWDNALGTIGAGNHFAEIQVVEESSLAKEENGLCQNDVVLLVHSGSRGYGGSVLKKFTTETRTSFEDGTADATDYMKEQDKACKWAKANRDLIALRFLACLEPGNESWSLGSSDADEFDDDSVKMIGSAKMALQRRKVVDIWHNNVERVPWPPSAPPLTPKDASLTEVTDKLTLSDNTQQQYAYIHRKGAAPTYDPETQVPLGLLPLPGSRGTPTLILQPTFSDSTSWGLKNGLLLAMERGGPCLARRLCLR